MEINIHHSARDNTERVIFYKNKVYTEKEYLNLLYKKRLIKDVISIIIFIILMVLRLYIFLKYGV